MKKHTSIRFYEKILTLLNEDAIKNDIKLSEQVRRIVDKHYENSGLSIGERVMKAAKRVHEKELSHQKKIVPHSAESAPQSTVVPQISVTHTEIVPQKRELILRDRKTESPDDIVFVNGRPTVRKNLK